MIPLESTLVDILKGRPMGGAMSKKVLYNIPLVPIGYVNRVRRISTELMTAYKGKFGVDFKQNKKLLDEVAVVRSKGLKNEIAGYIATHLKRELEEQKEKESIAPQEEAIVETEEMEEQLVS